MRRALLPLALLFAVSVFAASPLTFANRGVMGDARLMPGVRVDGRLSEWGGGLPMRLDNAGQNIMGGGRWMGPADLSGRFAVAYDDRNLYIAGEVRDDQVVNDQSGILIWNGDCVQFFIDADPEGDSAVRSYNEDDFHLGVSPGTDGRRPGWVFWQPAGGRARATLGMERTGDGYTFEIAIPLSILNLSPAPGRMIGFGITLSDSDAPKEVKTQLSNADANAWRDPGGLGRIIFR